MSIKIILKWFFKAFVAGVMALFVASLVCIVYYNPPKAIITPYGISLTAYRPNTFYCEMGEGFGFGKTDSYGYMDNNNNPSDIDILIIGSSHMEAKQVLPSQRTSSILEEITNMKVFNAGVQGNEIKYCIRTLKQTLNISKPKYVIIETDTTSLNNEEIMFAIDDSDYGNVSQRGRLYNLLQDIPYARLAYKQLQQFFVNNISDNVNIEVNTEDTSLKKDTKADYDVFFKYISDVCKSYDVKPIIMYHESFMLNNDGTVTPAINEDTLKLFSDSCEANDIIFVDMTSDFIKMYEKDNKLPHGFNNTTLGFGHLNKYGHETIAKRLAQVIKEDKSKEKQ